MTSEEMIYTLTRMKRMAEEYAKGYPDYNATEDIEALDKAISLLKAEGEGLIVRLPCKVGTKLYTIESKESEECDQDRIVPWIIWKIEYIDSDNTTDGQNQITIYYERTDDIFYDDRSCELDDIGKTVFLTREEAAAKVEGMK